MNIQPPGGVFFQRQVEDLEGQQLVHKMTWRISDAGLDLLQVGGGGNNREDRLIAGVSGFDLRLRKRTKLGPAASP